MNEPRLAVPTAPLSMDIAITGRCNLRCRYCFYADEMAARSDLPAERWLAFFRELGRLAVQRVCLTGGEPFTRPDLWDLLDGLIANRMRYQILSNGTLINEQVLAHFEVGKRRLRLDFIQVSIDGSRAEIHNRSRPDSFDRALRGLCLLLEAGLPATVRVTVNRYNVDDLENIAYLLLEEVGLPAFSTDEVNPCGLVARQGEELLLTPFQRRRAMEVLSRLAERYDGRIMATSGPLALARNFREMEEARVGGKEGLPGGGTLSSCGGCFSRLAVHHDGTLVPCHQLATLPLGTAGVDDLQQVWLEHPLLQDLRQRRSIPLESLESCRDCPYRNFCRGGCPAGALFLIGRLDECNPRQCYRVFQAEGSCFRPAIGLEV